VSHDKVKLLNFCMIRADRSTQGARYLTGDSPKVVRAAEFSTLILGVLLVSYNDFDSTMAIRSYKPLFTYIKVWAISVLYSLYRPKILIWKRKTHRQLRSQSERIPFRQTHHSPMSDNMILVYFLVRVKIWLRANCPNFFG
jgi:hypothetical protein